MADKQDTTSASPTETEPSQTSTEPKNVEIKTPTTVSKKQDDLSNITPDIVAALSFDSKAASEKDLRSHNSQLQGLLGKVIELLKEKSALCSNLERQNNALMLQTNSLKDVVAITKDLLSIRNMEVEHLHLDIKSMEEKINQERERHNNMLNRMSEAIKLNENLKTEYQSQLGLFTDLRARYEEKVIVLENENKRLLSLVTSSGNTNPSQGAEQAGDGEGDVQLSLEAISPP